MWPIWKLGIDWPWHRQLPLPHWEQSQVQPEEMPMGVPSHLVSSNPSLSPQLTRSIPLAVQLELALPPPMHLKEGLRVRKQRGPQRGRLPDPRRMSEPQGIGGLQGLETVVQAPPVYYDDPTRVVEVKNELTGQIWNFKDVGSMTGPDGAFMLRGQWPPGVYRIENRIGVALRITLWNKSHDIQPGETWRFGAHGEIGRDAEMIEKRRLH